MKTVFPSDYEAVKVVKGKEIDSVDPLCSVDVTDDDFVISNGLHEYREPRSEYGLWIFRPARKET